MKPVEELTDEELRIEIAEFCGWTKDYIHGNGVDDELWISPTGLTGGRVGDPLNSLPNYPQDLNAMWEAEEKLDKNEIVVNEEYPYLTQWSLYCKNLCKSAIRHQFRSLHATAKQRAIAFVKTIRSIQK